MKTRKTVQVLLLCAALLAAFLCPASAAHTARLYNVYGDHMLFRQNEPAVFAGVSAPGAVIGATLKNAAGGTVATATGKADENGCFSVSFPAPAGSYEAYTVTLTENGTAVQTLRDVVFGELWLSFGQSNMEYNLHGTPEGRAMKAANETGSPHLRVLQVPHPTKNGAFASDSLPQTEAQGCFWYRGDNAEVYNMSACAYFFASALIEELDMPVGILNAAVGGSALEAWIPRAAIEADDAVFSLLNERGRYIPLSDWDKGDRAFHIDMSGLYNSKLAPLTNFRPAGGIWYQGETDFMLRNSADDYMNLFRLMQNSLTDAFSHEDGSLPLVFTQLVTFCYNEGPYAETRFNDAFTRLASEAPESRGEVTVSDLTPAYYDEWGAIHPMTKKPIGERMAASAMGLVYGASTPASAPAAIGSKAENGGVTLTFSNVGDGLVSTGDTLRGFSVYGKDGVCVRADAEITGPDTVRVWSEAVPEPAGAAYAMNSLSPDANLWSSVDGAPYLPAAAAGAADQAITKYCDLAPWQICESLTAWENHRDTAGEKDVWTAENAVLSRAADAYEGEASLEIRGEKRRFSVSPVLAEPHNGKPTPFDSVDPDYTRSGTIVFRLKNAGKSPVKLEQLRFYEGRFLYICPAALTGTELPADGAWHTFRFDLNDLAVFGSPAARLTNDSLTGVTEIRLCFAGDGAVLLADDFRFTPETAVTDRPPLQRLVDAVQALLAKLTDLFNDLKAKITAVC